MSDDGPVLILQNLTPDGAGQLGTWLRAHGVAHEVFDTEAGDVYPSKIAGYRALALLGGEMSANDDLPSLRAAERLIVQAMQAGVPVIGHCLGGHLMARALGAEVIATPAPEIGWQTIQMADTPAARAWFGDAAELTIYHWHHESFGLPPGAQLLGGSKACPHQAFAIGPHPAMQFHLELDAHKLADWSASSDPTCLRWQQQHVTVQGAAAMCAQAQSALPAQQCLADSIYRRWLGFA